jgi:hypothetical protein
MVSLSARPPVSMGIADDEDANLEDDTDLSVFADAPGALSSPDDKLKFVTGALQKAQSYRDKADSATQKLREYRQPPGATLLALGSALLSPTRTGSFGETIGNVGRVLGDQAQQRSDLDYKRRLIEADALAKRYESAAKGQEKLAEVGARAAFAKPANPTRLMTDSLGNVLDPYTGAIIRKANEGNAIFVPETRDGVRGQKDTRTGEWKPFEKYAQPGGDKGAGMLPATLQKAEDADLDAIGTYAGIQSDVDTLRNQIKTGELDLSLVGNIGAQAKNALGVGDEKSAAFDVFKSTLENIVNNTLMLAKGMQTEGDAKRAKSQLMSNLSSEKNVATQLERISKINERSAKLRANILQRRRTARGLEAADLSEYLDMPTALPSKASPSAAPSERPPLSSFRK